MKLSLKFLFLYQLFSSTQSATYTIVSEETLYFKMNEAEAFEFDNCTCTQTPLLCEVKQYKPNNIPIPKKVDDVSIIIIYNDNLYQNCFAFVHSFNNIAFTFNSSASEIEKALIHNSISISQLIGDEALKCYNIQSGGAKNYLLMFCMSKNIYAIIIENTFNCQSELVTKNSAFHKYRLNEDITSQKPEQYEIKRYEEYLLLMYASTNSSIRSYETIHLYEVTTDEQKFYDYKILAKNQTHYSNISDINFLQQENSSYLHLIVTFIDDGMCKVSLKKPISQYETLNCAEPIETLSTFSGDKYYSNFVLRPSLPSGIVSSEPDIEVSMITKNYIVSYIYKDSKFIPSFKKKLNATKYTEDQGYRHFNVDDQFYYYQQTNSIANQTHLIIYERSLRSIPQQFSRANSDQYYIPFLYYSEQQCVSSQMDKKFLFFSGDEVDDHKSFTDRYIQDRQIIKLKHQGKVNELITVPCNLSNSSNEKISEFEVQILPINYVDVQLSDKNKSNNSRVYLPEFHTLTAVDFPLKYFQGQGLSFSEKHNKKYLKGSVNLQEQTSDLLKNLTVNAAENNFKHIIFSLITKNFKVIVYQYAYTKTQIDGNASCTFNHSENLILQETQIYDDNNELVLIYQEVKAGSFHIYTYDLQKNIIKEENISISQAELMIATSVELSKYAQFKVFAHAYFKNVFFLVSDTIFEQEYGQLQQKHVNYFLYTKLSQKQLQCVQIQPMNRNDELISLDLALLKQNLIFFASMYQIYYIYFNFQNNQKDQKCSQLIIAQEFKFENKTAPDTQIKLRMKLLNFPYFNISIPPAIMIIREETQVNFNRVIPEELDVYFLRNMLLLNDLEHMRLPINLIQEKGNGSSVTNLTMRTSFELNFGDHKIEFLSKGALSDLAVVDKFLYIKSYNQKQNELTLFVFNFLEESGKQLTCFTKKQSVNNNTYLWLIPTLNTQRDQYNSNQPIITLIELFGVLNNSFNTATINWTDNHIIYFFPPHLIVQQQNSQQKDFIVQIVANNYHSNKSISLYVTFQFAQEDRLLQTKVESNLISHKNEQPTVNDSIFIGSLWNLSLRVDNENKTYIHTSKHLSNINQIPLIGTNNSSKYELISNLLVLVRNNTKIVIYTINDNRTNTEICTMSTQFPIINFSASDVFLDEKKQNIAIYASSQEQCAIFIVEIISCPTNTPQEVSCSNFLHNSSFGINKQISHLEKQQISFYNSDFLIISYCFGEKDIKSWTDRQLLIQVYDLKTNATNSTIITAVDLEVENYFECELIKAAQSKIYFSAGAQKFYQVKLQILTVNNFTRMITSKKLKGKGFYYLNEAFIIEVEVDQNIFFLSSLNSENASNIVSNYYFSGHCSLTRNFGQFMVFNNQIILPCFNYDENHLLIQYYIQASDDKKQNFMKEVYSFKATDLLSFQISQHNKEEAIFNIIFQYKDRFECYQFETNQQVVANFHQLTNGSVSQGILCGSGNNLNEQLTFSQACVTVILDNQDYEKIYFSLACYQWILFALAISSYIFIIFVCNQKFQTSRNQFFD